MAAILRAGHVDELSRVRPCGLSIDPSAPQPASATVGSAFPNSACSSTATIRAAKKATAGPQTQRGPSLGLDGLKVLLRTSSWQRSEPRSHWWQT